MATNVVVCLDDFIGPSGPPGEGSGPPTYNDTGCTGGNWAVVDLDTLGGGGGLPSLSITDASVLGAAIIGCWVVAWGAAQIIRLFHTPPRP